MGVRRVRSRWLRGFLLAATVSVIGATPVAADTNLTVGGQAVVSNTDGDGVNVRNAAGYDGQVITALPEGAEVTVTGGPNQAADGSYWYQVNSNGTDGWIISDYLSQDGAASYASVLTVTGTDGNGLRLRSDPSLDSSTLTVLPEGAQVSGVGPDVNGGEYVWANVSYQGTTGYAAKDYLSASSDATAAVAAAPSGIAVGANAEVVGTGGDGLNLRSDASFGAGVVAVAPEGAVVHVIDGSRTDGAGTVWWGVDYSGMKGWMSADYLGPTDKQPTQGAAAQSMQTVSTAPAASSIGEQIAATAIQYVGYPYVWGGTTPAGFDCSGFTFFVVNEVTGGGFPRDIFAQASSGSYVDPNNLQPGDIVFQQNTYQWGLSHVGIYVGNGQMVNAANESAGVTISNIWDSYWGPRYYTARRIG